MYADNARNRMLALTLLMSLFLMMSIGLNIKQYLDVGRYQSLASEAANEVQTLLENLRFLIPATVVQAPPPPAVIASRTIAVDKNELQCMSENIYFEAASQSLVGKMAVGHVVLNRIKSGHYPKTVCGVVNQRINDVCQFSWKCEGEKVRPSETNRAWKQSQQVAYDLLSRPKDELVDITEGATHFHNTKVKPGWKKKPVAKIDDHLFYK